MREDQMTAFEDAVRTDEWTHLVGTGADARARGARLRRTRYAGIAGATAAVVVGAAVVSSSFASETGGRGSTAEAGSSGGQTPVAVTSSAPTAKAVQTIAPGTMAALFFQWKTCPDSELTADPRDLQQRWRDACHRDVATLSALLPDYEVTPAVASIGTPSTDHPDILPTAFDDPEFVVPKGYTPHMGTAIYRIVGKDGATSKVYIHALAHDDNTKPITGEEVTLPNGLKAWLTLGTELQEKAPPGYEIYILDKGKTFYMFTGEHPNFDFKALVTSPQFADMAAKALAEPES